MESSVKLKAMITIVDYSLTSKIMDIYLKNNLPVHAVTHGHGSAGSEILDYLGFGETKKGVVLSVITSKTSNCIFNVLASEMNFNKPGTGIAFTLPLSGVSSFLSSVCMKAEEEIDNIGEVDNMTECNYELIITIVTKGHFGDVMDAAKAAGATGGTLVHARGMGTEEAVKFLGITIQPEKDFIFIIAPKNKKQGIMKSITQKTGLSTAGKGICFSLPVDSAIGISFN